MSDDTQTIELPITGMTCASCVARNERALRRVEGVSEASVNFATEKATIALTRRRGLRGPGPHGGGGPLRRGHAQQTLPILGMTCASCVGRVEKALRRPPGVLDVSVNLATEKATVTYVPGQATRDDLVAAVRAAGYDVVEQAAPAAGADDRGAEAAVRRPRGGPRRLLSRPAAQGRRRLVLSTLIFAGTMQADWFTFLPSWLSNGYVLWALATWSSSGRARSSTGPPGRRLRTRHHRHEHADRGRHVGRLPLQRRRRSLFPGLLRAPGPGRCRRLLRDLGR